MMLSISGLAFLGLGIKPPTPELGTILFDGKSYFNGAPWLFFFPGVLLGGFALLCQMIDKNNAMNTVVKVNQLSILDHNRSLLNDVNLTITKGHFIAL